MNSDIKNIIKKEYIKCSQNPVYFMRKYCMIQHPTRGRIKFNLYPFQEKVLNLLNKHDKDIILKSRQLGLSTLVAGMALHLMLFNSDKNVLVIATTQATAKNLVTKVKFMFDGLPSWLKKKPKENNSLSLKLHNDSVIKAVAASENASRSEAISLLIIDEGAFIEENRIEPIWASAQQTLATGGSSIILSTPNGTGNFFHRMWVKAEEGVNGFTPIRLPWHIHPERDQEWRNQQDDELGARLAAQECDCDFLTSGLTVIPHEILEYYEKNTVKEPIEKRGIGNDYWLWEQPDYSQDYIVISDCARGDSTDYSTFHVFNIKTVEQVASFKAQLGTKEFGNLLVNVSTEWNNALLVIENANIGWAVLQQVIERGYQNLYYSPKDNKYLDANKWTFKGYDFMDKNKMIAGFTNSTATRPLIIAKLDAYMKDKTPIIHCTRTLQELRTFIWKDGKAQAQSGYNDDLVIPLAIAFYVRDTAIAYAQHGVDLTKAAIQNISKGNYDPAMFSSRKFDSQGAKSWEMDIGNNINIDLRWLIR